jgi:hypothetical protein
MPVVLKNVPIYLGEFALKTKSNTVEVSHEVEEKDVTHLGTDTKLAYPGLFTTGGSIEGFMDLGVKAGVAGGVAPMEQVLWDYIGQTSGIPFSIVEPGGGAAEASRAYLWRPGLISSPVFQGGAGDVHPFTITMPTFAGDLVRGFLLEPEGNKTGSGNSTGFAKATLAPSATQKVYAALHVLDIDDGSPSGASLDVVIESSATGAWAGEETTRITFATASDATSEWASVAGPITDTYWRAKWTLASATDWNGVVSIGVGAA